jgi:hypothetical protein
MKMLKFTYLCTLPAALDLLEQQFEVVVGQVRRCRPPSRGAHGPGHLAGPDRSRNQFEGGGRTTYRLPVHKSRPDCNAARSELRMAPTLVRVVGVGVHRIGIRSIELIEQRRDVIGRFARFDTGRVLHSLKEVEGASDCWEVVCNDFC